VTEGPRSPGPLGTTSSACSPGGSVTLCALFRQPGGGRSAPGRRFRADRGFPRVTSFGRGDVTCLRRSETVLAGHRTFAERRGRGGRVRRPAGVRTAKGER
jgi:hypothetical protein